MMKHNVIVPEDLAVKLTSVSSVDSAPFLTYPLSRAKSTGTTTFAGYKKLLSQLELGSGGGWINAWIDSMRASSPTRVRPTTDYENWLKEQPSALTNFEEIIEELKGKQIVMFLDYDGTLSPIVEDPDRAFMSDDMRATVKELAKHFPTAIVSGRCRDKVQRFVGLSGLYYAGSHGMDIKVPRKGTKLSKLEARAKPVLFQPASEFLPVIDEVYKLLVKTIETIPGSRVENNKFCLSVHFRCVEEKKWNLLAEKVKAVLKDYPQLRLSHGRKVLEIRPTIKWDKGKALEYLMESLGFMNRNDIFPVYIGDDRTDEDAFKVLRDRGQGFGILVSKRAKETEASYSLQEPAEVMAFLRRLVQWEITRG